MTQEAQEQQDCRLAHADGLPKELVELETEFTDEWLKDHNFTPTFADAIGWARDKQRAELVDMACDLLWDIVAPYVNTSEDCEAIQGAFRKAIIKEDEL